MPKKIKGKEYKVGMRTVVTDVYDFGLFPSKRTVNIPHDQWIEYIETRAKFEKLHWDIGKLFGENIPIIL